MTLNGPSPGSGDGFAVFVESSTLIVNAKSTLASGKQATTTLADGTWYHLVVLKTATQINNIFINGTDVSASDSVDFLGTFTAGNTFAIYIDATNFPFNGILDEVHLYNGTLASGWITAEYNNQKASSTFLTVGSEI